MHTTKTEQMCCFSQTWCLKIDKVKPLCKCGRRQWLKEGGNMGKSVGITDLIQILTYYSEQNEYAVGTIVDLKWKHLK